MLVTLLLEAERYFQVRTSLEMKFMLRCPLCCSRRCGRRSIFVKKTEACVQILSGSIWYESVHENQQQRSF